MCAAGGLGLFWIYSMRASACPTMCAGVDFVCEVICMLYSTGLMCACVIVVRQSVRINHSISL